MEKWFLSKDSSCVTLFVNDTIYGEVESIQPVKTETGMMKVGVLTNWEFKSCKY